MAVAYKVLNSVGKGMTSQVYRAQDPSGKIVAIKELLPEHRSNPKRIKDLEKEVSSTRDLKHPNTVNLIDFDPDRYRVVLEFMPKSLRQAMQKEPFHYENRLRWALDVTEALAHLHKRRLIHKDIKPENIFLTEQGQAKLGDFGFLEQEAGMVGRLRTLLVKPRIQGTISYLSPEQVRRHPLTTKSDIFSWGAVLYEMFAGKRPFTSPGENLSLVVGSNGASLDIIKQISRKEPKSPRSLNPKIEPELEALILRCLSKTPSGRPDALSVKSSLKRILAKFS